jgi:hypothetical protein
MTAGPIANQRINCLASVTLTNGEKKVLEPGAYVKAIHRDYIPHNHPFEEIDHSRYVVIFSSYGFGYVERYTVDWYVY